MIHLLIVLFAWTLSQGAASAREPDPATIRASKEARAVRITEPIRVDGILDEATWRHAEPATDFYQQQPAEFEPATRRTEVRFVYDDEALYVGAMLYDEAPELAIVNDLKRDFSGRNGDMFGVILDTFQDRRNAYGFVTNPGGAQRETQAYENGRRNDANWHGVWFVRTAVVAEGWSVEFMIPFRTLRFPERVDQVWGLNLIRIVRRDNETATWSPVPRQFSQYNVQYAGTLTGIAGVARGRSLQVKPFATADVSRAADAGLDMKWGVTSSLTLDATLRTDFSQVEADEQQINLTRFGLFFPEKREFFLENPASFQIGLVEPENQRPRRDLVPFFSRRIGLSAAGVPIPVVGGLRVTGRAAGASVGALTMQTEAFEGAPGENFTALRMSRDVGPSATAGAFYFGRTASGEDSFNRVGGVDVRLRPSAITEVEGFVLRSESSGQSGGFAGRGGIRVDGNAHRLRIGHVHVDEAFRHDLGYVRRRGIGTLFSSYSRIVRPAQTTGRIREHAFAIEYEATSDDRYSRTLTRIGGVNYSLLLADGSELRTWLNSTHETLDRSFRVGPVLEIPVGRYAFEDLGVSFQGNQSAPFSWGAEMSGGEFWTGRQRAISGDVRYRANAHLAVSATLSRSVVHLPAGSFHGDLVGVRLDWSFSPRMFLNALVQYNSEADAWLSNVRYNFIHRPLSDIYVVWNETRVGTDRRRALLLKYTHLIAF